jgi:hypothetical protein
MGIGLASPRKTQWCRIRARENYVLISPKPDVGLNFQGPDPLAFFSGQKGGGLVSGFRIDLLTSAGV